MESTQSEVTADFNFYWLLGSSMTISDTILLLDDSVHSTVELIVSNWANTILFTKDHMHARRLTQQQSPNRVPGPLTWSSFLYIPTMGCLLPSDKQLISHEMRSGTG